jgi:hypothetical protein
MYLFLASVSTSFASSSFDRLGPIITFLSGTTSSSGVVLVSS